MRKMRKKVKMMKMYLLKMVNKKFLIFIFLDISEADDDELDLRIKIKSKKKNKSDLLNKKPQKNNELRYGQKIEKNTMNKKKKF